MAVCRNGPFDEYHRDPTIAAAVEDLDSLAGYQGPHVGHAAEPVPGGLPRRAVWPDGLAVPAKPFRYDRIEV